MLPFLPQRLGFDPASASAPFVATLVDVTGVVIYFNVAYVILRGTLLLVTEHPAGHVIRHPATDELNGEVLTASQNSRGFSTRLSGGLPAISAEFTAPIEMPATQSGWRFASASA
jgi:hypothetical protein